MGVSQSDQLWIYNKNEEEGHKDKVTDREVY